MRVAVLGYGQEGQSAERFFQKHDAEEVVIFDNFKPEDISHFGLEDFDLVMRSPSVPPLQEWSSSTKYFFEHCPCPVIGVTGTKGKGTTCSLITAILEKLGKKVWLLGNIGKPALDVLDEIKKTDVVVYEMSSFQLWDLNISPHIAVILKIEPDHLNVHTNFTEYVTAKANIVKHQTTQDYCIYYRENPESSKIAQQSQGKLIPYPSDTNRTKIDKVLDSLIIPGKHNRENAEAALLAVANLEEKNITELLEQFAGKIEQALSEFKGLPNRLEYLRTIDNIDFYNDNFCTNVSSLKVALEAFPDKQIILIAGGRDKTENKDIPEIRDTILNAGNVAKTILIGESGKELAKVMDSCYYREADSLQNALDISIAEAKIVDKSKDIVVLMSPAAASFDMFKNVYDRGAQFRKLVMELEYGNDQRNH